MNRDRVKQIAQLFASFAKRGRQGNSLTWRLIDFM
jgi:hypothetical protein